MSATTDKPLQTGVDVIAPSPSPARSVRFRRFVCSLSMLIAAGSALVTLSSSEPGYGYRCETQDTVFYDDCPTACSVTQWSPRGPGECRYTGENLYCVNQTINAIPTVWIGTCIGTFCRIFGPGHQLDPMSIGSCVHWPDSK